MVWGENNNDENKNNKNPWGNKGSDNLDEILKESQKKIKDLLNKNKTPSPKLPGNVVLVGFIVALVAWLASGFYIIEEDEQAVVLRLGKFTRIANPGPNYHLPFPVESVTKHKVTKHQIEEFGFRSANTDVYRLNRKADSRNIPEESLMLTGDENIVDVHFMVKWKINDIQKYVFNLENPRESVKMAAESAVREVIGNTAFAEVQTGGRSKVEEKSMQLLQAMLDLYNSGVSIVNLQMLKIDPPQQVIDAFRDVQTARADREREINEAYSFKNDLIPRARGEAAKIEQEALAYKQEVILNATGESSRFKAVLEQYKMNKATVRKRMYLETMESILSDVNKVIIDPSAKNLVPFLPLNELNKK